MFDLRKTHNWMQLAEGQEFLDEAALKLKHDLSVLKTARDQTDLQRAQGRVEILEWLLKPRKADG